VIYTRLYNEIKTILEKVSNVKEIHEAPTDIFTKYPAVVFFPAGVSNVFSTTSDNFKEYRFKMFVLAGTEGTNMNNIFVNVLSNTSDKILEQFDEDWSLNNIDGHRVWLRIEAGTWGLEKTNKGLTAISEFDILVKLSTSI
jgi:hypothetical protein